MLLRILRTAHVYRAGAFPACRASGRCTAVHSKQSASLTSLSYAVRALHAERIDAVACTLVGAYLRAK